MSTTKKEDIVWGAGCISPGAIGEDPLKVYAVRGPLTRKELNDRGVECPKVYGDPALLFPKIYNPPRNIKYKYGLIPHYIDYTNEYALNIITYLESQGVKIINITNNTFKFNDYFKSVDRELIFKTFIDNTPSIDNLELLPFNTKINFNPDILLKAGPWNDNNCTFF
jgi:hypothetical protein